MDKKLSEMTLEELWRLFPVVLTEHNPHRDAYTDAKGAFVKKYTAIARREQEDKRE